MEFDYQIKGETEKNWFAFWLESNTPAIHHDVDDTEIDLLIKKPNTGPLRHDFGGRYGLPKTFQEGQNMKAGHITAWITDEGFEMTDCQAGLKSCTYDEDLVAKKTFSEETQADLRSGKLKYHWVINYFLTKSES